MLENKLITIGKITRPVGLKGYVKVLSLTDFPDRFRNLKHIKLFNERENLVLKNKFSNSEDFYVKDVIFEKDYFKILFDDYNDVGSVSGLIGCFLVISEAKRKKLEKGKYYYDELIGLKVIDKSGIIGSITSVENYGGQDLLKISLHNDNRNILIPYVNEFVKKIDIEKGFAEINMIDGMLN